LDKSLAYARHFPAINWTISYSEYLDDLRKWYDTNVDRRFVTLRAEMMSVLHEETQLMEIVKLIGADVLPDDQKLVLEIARVIRVGYLQQNAFHPEDTYVPFEKQFKMLQLISYLKEQCQRLISTRRTIRAIVATGIFEDLIKIKYDVKNSELDKLDAYYEKIDLALASVQ
jgi:V/A-type H+-transporting ATPase subunit A